MSVDWITISLGNGPDSKVHGANMGPIWGCQDPGGPHVGPMNFAICGVACQTLIWKSKLNYCELAHSQSQQKWIQEY